MLYQVGCQHEAEPAHLAEHSPSLKLQLSGGGQQAPFPTLPGLSGWWELAEMCENCSLKELRDWSEKCDKDAEQSGSRKWV